MSMTVVLCMTDTCYRVTRRIFGFMLISMWGFIFFLTDQSSARMNPKRHLLENHVNALIEYHRTEILCIRSYKETACVDFFQFQETKLLSKKQSYQDKKNNQILLQYEPCCYVLCMTYSRFLLTIFHQCFN